MQPELEDFEETCNVHKHRNDPYKILLIAVVPQMVKPDENENMVHTDRQDCGLL